MPPTRPDVMIGTPCYGGLVTHVYLNSMLRLTNYASKHNFSVGLFTTAHASLITLARSNIFAAFLDRPSATHLMFIDADIGFAPEHVHRLLTFDEDVAAGMYPIKNIDWAKAQATAGGAAELRESGLHFVGVPCPAVEREERDGFVTGRYAGAGFMLIRRSAAERLAAAYPETRYRALHTYPSPERQSQNWYALFESIIDPETGTYLTEDFAFCHRWRRIGGKVWLDTKSRFKHVGSYEFEGTARL